MGLGKTVQSIVLLMGVMVSGMVNSRANYMYAHVSFIGLKLAGGGRRTNCEENVTA